MGFVHTQLRVIITLILLSIYAGISAQRCGTLTPSHNNFSTSGPISSRSTIVIPVVFHVVARTVEEDISDAQIKSQIDILNQEFAGMQRNNDGINPDFLTVRGFANVKFCLASLDPNNEPTKGITRTITTVESIAESQAPGGRTAIFYDAYEGKSGWPPEDYINIWIGQAQFFGGKASFPEAVLFPEEEGIILDPRFVGDIGLARDNQPYHLGKTLIHEMGHYLNLRHIWGTGPGGSCGDDDGIADTPFQLFPYVGCPIDDPVSCDSRDMYINYMDNTDDACIRMFTQGQVAIMLSSLQNHRSQLINNGKCEKSPASIKIKDATYLYDQHLIQTTFEGADGEKAQILIYNIQGQLIIKKTFSAFEYNYISADNLLPATYIIYVILEDEVFQKKVVVL